MKFGGARANRLLNICWLLKKTQWHASEIGSWQNKIELTHRPKPMTISRARLMNKKRLGNEEVCLTCVFCNTVLAYKFIMTNGCFSSSLLFPFALSNQTASWCTQQLKTMQRKRNQQHTITNTRNYATSSFEKCIFFHVQQTIFFMVLMKWKRKEQPGRVFLCCSTDKQTWTKYFMRVCYCCANFVRSNRERVHEKSFFSFRLFVFPFLGFVFVIWSRRRINRRKPENEKRDRGRKALGTAKCWIKMKNDANWSMTCDIILLAVDWRDALTLFRSLSLFWCRHWTPGMGGTSVFVLWRH